MTTAPRGLSVHSTTSITQFVQKAFAPNPVVQFRIRDRMVKCASVCIMAEFSISSSVVRSKMPELDTLRGIAVLLVLFFHGFNLVPIPHEISSTAGRLWVSLLPPGGWASICSSYFLAFNHWHFDRVARLQTTSSDSISAARSASAGHYAILSFCYWSRTSAWWTAAWAGRSLVSVSSIWQMSHHCSAWRPNIRLYGLWRWKNTSISFGLLPSDTSRAGSCSHLSCHHHRLPVLRALYYVRGYNYGRHTLGWWPIPGLRRCPGNISSGPIASAPSSWPSHRSRSARESCCS